MLTALLTPGCWDDRRAAYALAMSTGGGVLLEDQGYSGEAVFDRLYDEAQILRVMPSDEDKPGLCQSGAAACRKQFFEPLAAIRRSSLRPVLVWTMDGSAAEAASAEAASFQHGACRSYRSALIQSATEIM